MIQDHSLRVFGFALIQFAVLNICSIKLAGGGIRMNNYGPMVQVDIRKEVSIPIEARLPISYRDWKNEARKVLDPGAFYYIACGAGAGYTMLANREAFYNWRIRPRVLIDVSERDLTVSLYGRTFTGPVFLAPAGSQILFHPDGELASARAASTIGIPFILSTFSSYSIEDVASVMGDSPRWFQLYWGKDYDVMASLLNRAENSGYQAIVVTVDRPLPGWRECDLHYLYPPLVLPRPVTNYITDPVFLSKLSKPPQADIQGAIAQIGRIINNPSFSWRDLSFLFQHTKLPILLKGIMHPDDARQALDYGINGIIVSNHGGRHLDGAEATMNALPKITEVIQGRIPVLMDSGIRHGADVVKAIALGALAVLLCRPYLYGLAVAGEEGVRRVTRNLLAETDITMANSGNNSVSEINRALLVKRK